MTDILFPELSYAVQGACFDVHNRLRGLDLSEAGWEKALTIALTKRGIGSESQVKFQLAYRGGSVGQFAVDVVVDDKLLLELKAVEKLLPIHQAQVLSYLRVSGLELGILINFGEPRVASQRLVLQSARNEGATDVPQPGQPVNPEGLLYPEVTERLRCVLLAVHNTLGPGFMHMHYRRATFLELGDSGLSFRKQEKVTVSYQGQPIETRETHLLIIEGKIALACVASHPSRQQWFFCMRQFLNCLAFLGLIANFHNLQMEITTVRV